jgi:hypothetical protein
MKDRFPRKQSFTSNEKIRCTGQLRIFAKQGDTWVLQQERKNLVVDTGLELLAMRMKNNAENPLTHIAVGTGTNAVLASNTALQTQLFRKAIDNIDTPGLTLIAEVTFTAGEANDTWRECGMFNAAVGGVLFNRLLINYTKSFGEETKLEFTITFSATT